MKRSSRMNLKSLGAASVALWYRSAASLLFHASDLNCRVDTVRPFQMTSALDR
jgi:hypothetical protein